MSLNYELQKLATRLIQEYLGESKAITQQDQKQLALAWRNVCLEEVVSFYLLSLAYDVL